MPCCALFFVWGICDVDGVSEVRCTSVFRWLVVVILTSFYHLGVLVAANYVPGSSSAIATNIKTDQIGQCTSSNSYLKRVVESASVTAWFSKILQLMGSVLTQYTCPYCGCQLIFPYFCIPLMRFEEEGWQLTGIDLCIPILGLCWTLPTVLSNLYLKI
jgi:hypothetical protein